MKKNRLLKELRLLFPSAQCELDFNSSFQLLIAVVLSAQTTDQKVNKVTAVLFDKYADEKALAKADINEVIEIIKPIGLANNKSKNIINLSKALVERHNGKVPDDYDALVALPGVGRKTANVVLLEGFGIATIPVDTHVARVSKRLGLADEQASVYEVEMQLRVFLPRSNWIEAHQLLIHFGRYLCKAIKPECERCPFIKECQK